MAAVGIRIASSEISTGTSRKTLLQIVAASNHAVKIKEVSISFKGTSNTDAPILIEVARQNTAGTMTSLTVKKDPDDSDETLQTTAQENATAEPTTGDVLKREYCHPQQGVTIQLPFDHPHKIGGGDRLAVLVTAANSVNAVASASGEE